MYIRSIILRSDGGGAYKVSKDRHHYGDKETIDTVLVLFQKGGRDKTDHIASWKVGKQLPERAFGWCQHRVDSVNFDESYNDQMGMFHCIAHSQR